MVVPHGDSTDLHPNPPESLRLRPSPFTLVDIKLKKKTRTKRPGNEETKVENEPTFSRNQKIKKQNLKQRRRRRSGPLRLASGGTAKEFLFFFGAVVVEIGPSYRVLPSFCLRETTSVGPVKDVPS